jgi:hypothetical protein
MQQVIEKVESERNRPREVKQLTVQPCLVDSYKSEEVMTNTSFS